MNALINSGKFHAQLSIFCNFFYQNLEIICVQNKNKQKNLPNQFHRKIFIEFLTKKMNHENCSLLKRFFINNFFLQKRENNDKNSSISNI